MHRVQGYGVMLTTGLVIGLDMVPLHSCPVPAMLDLHFISSILEAWKQKMPLLLLLPWRTKPG